MSNVSNEFLSVKYVSLMLENKIPAFALAGMTVGGAVQHNDVILTNLMPSYKVIREKSRGEGSLIGQDTIENVSEPKFFFLTF